MARIVTPGSLQPGNSGPRRSRPFFATELIQQHGVRAVFAILVAALFAFSPLAVLYWFNSLWLQSVITTTIGQPVVVKPGQKHDEQEREEPGETALLEVRCDVPSFNDWQELLEYGDPANANQPGFESRYVRHELVYVRRAGSSAVPFALLGSPPVSVWLPEGDYQILVVHEAPRNDTRIWVPGPSYPLLSVFSECSLESRKTTVCRVPLPHYETGDPNVLLQIGNAVEPTAREPSLEELAPLISECETLNAIPTPGGYILNLPEPLIHHQDGHRGCAQDFDEQQTVRREWTRDQIATLRNWLPRDAVQAKARLSVLIDRLQWREFLQGWFCYAAAGISGLVFTKWGAIEMVDPWRHGRTRSDSLRLIIRIFLFSVAAWFVLKILTTSSFKTLWTTKPTRQFTSFSHCQPGFEIGFNPSGWYRFMTI